MSPNSLSNQRLVGMVQPLRSVKSFSELVPPIVPRTNLFRLVKEVSTPHLLITHCLVKCFDRSPWEIPNGFNPLKNLNDNMTVLQV